MKVIATFVTPLTIAVGGLVVAITVVKKLDKIRALQKLVGRIKKSPKIPLTRAGLTLVVMVGGVPAGENGELVKPSVTVPTNPRVANVLVTTLPNVCWKKLKKLVVKFVVNNA